MKPKNIKIGLFVLVWITGLVDLISALMGRIEFESNPVFLLTGKSVILLIIVKIGLLIFLSWALWQEAKHIKNHRRYSAALLITYIILLQIVGAYSNISVTNKVMEKEVVTGEVVQPREPSAQMLSYFLFQLWTFLVPFIIAKIAFRIYDHIFIVRGEI